jgi:uncharacterized protein YdhG (YjbR/CyaY superfamily)
MPSEPTANSIDEYIARFPPETQTALEQMRALIGSSAPEATEAISYAIPTFDLNGRHLLHFAGYERHIGLYPVPRGGEAFSAQLDPFRSGRASARFPLGEPLPESLIRQIVEFRVAQNLRAASE